MARQTDYYALYTGKPTGQRRAPTTTVSNPPSDSTLGDVISFLNVIVTQNNRSALRNEELVEQVTRNEEEIRRLRSVLETSEETQAKIEERTGKMEKQIAALVESMRRNLSSQSQINATLGLAWFGISRVCATTGKQPPSLRIPPIVTIIASIIAAEPHPPARQAAKPPLSTDPTEIKKVMAIEHKPPPACTPKPRPAGRAGRPPGRTASRVVDNGIGSSTGGARLSSRPLDSGLGSSGTL
ncbi:hypothetical protein GTA08_BOTSDO13119 [Botryosphaeria dothidea]|uniref:Uncharacterized protein n=1 Tax=Botryosphaeria dothidea TaxID=55169 RepID=A0A8H4J3N3_9PEZI|nr:hypothetical protein GTA08_BOTSDO13119 [Botryosphaeria dothidea]